MLAFQARRSCRIAMNIPIRVFGIDYRGVDFIEEASTLVVNLHGAKIRMSHQLLPDSEIRVLSHPTNLDSVFRVVSKLQGGERKFTYWGVENLNPYMNIWGVEIPALPPDDQRKARVALQCPSCSAQESLPVDVLLLASLQEKGGVDRTCTMCRKIGLWKVPQLPA